MPHAARQLEEQLEQNKAQWQMLSEVSRLEVCGRAPLGGAQSADWLDARWHLQAQSESRSLQARLTSLQQQYDEEKASWQQKLTEARQRKVRRGRAAPAPARAFRGTSHGHPEFGGGGASAFARRL